MDKIKSLAEFLKSKVFLWNLAAAIAVVFGICMTVYFCLSSYTNHGESLIVPNLKGAEVKNLEQMLGELDLKYAIIDSIYNPKLPNGSVIEQEPAPQSKVKEGRTIYLTINSEEPPQIKMPNLIDVSYRQAEAILQTYGLKVGKIIYKPDLAKNAVLEQQLYGRSIKPGTPMKKGLVIDLVLGDGYGNTKVNVPSLLNLNTDEAIFALKGSSLNKGAIMADETVKDTMAAIVYKQVPEAIPGATLNQGESVDIYITQSPEKIKAIPQKPAEEPKQ